MGAHPQNTRVDGSDAQPFCRDGKSGGRATALQSNCVAHSTRFAAAEDVAV
jgi:hypothetical protein